MDLSIIIASYNTKDLLDRCVSSIYRSLQKSDLMVEIIVVDNSSTDGSVELLKTKYPRTVQILNKKNVGFGTGNNQGIKKATGTYILLLNSDIEVLSDSILKLYSFITTQPHAFAGGKLLNEDQSSQASCGPMVTIPVVCGMVLLRGDLWGLTRSSPSRVSRVDWVSGACLIGKKDAFVDTGLFDEGVFMYMEEIELLYRAKQKGYATLFYPDARFVHSGAASSASRKEPVVNIYLGLLYFYRKHMPIIDQQMLRILLRMKAVIGMGLGRLSGNRELRSTYEKAFSLVR